MPKAIVQNGVLVPVEPLPRNWFDGTEVNVEAIPNWLESPSSAAAVETS